MSNKNPAKIELIHNGLLQRGWRYKGRERYVDEETGKETFRKVWVETCIDKRAFCKGFNDKISPMLAIFQGMPKAQMPLIIEALINKNINKDDIVFSYKAVEEVLQEAGLKMWDRAVLSRTLKWALDNKFLFRSDKGKNTFWINLKYFYNGQIDISEEESETLEKDGVISSFPYPEEGRGFFSGNPMRLLRKLEEESYEKNINQ